MFIYFYDTEFDYSEERCVTKKEIIYYFNTLTKESIFYGLWKEFRKELSRKFSFLPLRRFSAASSVESSAKYEESAARARHFIKTISQKTLMRSDQAAGDNEVIARSGITPWRPQTTSYLSQLRNHRTKLSKAKYVVSTRPSTLKKTAKAFKFWDYIGRTFSFVDVTITDNSDQKDKMKIKNVVCKLKPDGTKVKRYLFQYTSCSDEPKSTEELLYEYCDTVLANKNVFVFEENGGDVVEDKDGDAAEEEEQQNKRQRINTDDTE